MFKTKAIKAIKALKDDLVQLAFSAGLPIGLLLLVLLVLYLFPGFIKGRDPATMSETLNSAIGCAYFTGIITLILGIFLFKRAFKYKFRVDVYNDIVNEGNTPHGITPEQHAVNTRKMRRYFYAAIPTAAIFVASYIVFSLVAASFLDWIKLTALVAFFVFAAWLRHIIWR